MIWFSSCEQLNEILMHALFLGTVGGRMHETSNPFSSKDCCIANVFSLQPMTTDMIGVISFDANGMLRNADSFKKNSHICSNFSRRQDSCFRIFNAVMV